MALDMFPCNPRELLPAQRYSGAAIATATATFMRFVGSC